MSVGHILTRNTFIKREKVKSQSKENMTQKKTDQGSNPSDWLTHLGVLVKLRSFFAQVFC